MIVSGADLHNARDAANGREILRHLVNGVRNDLWQGKATRGTSGNAHIIGLGLQVKQAIACAALIALAHVVDESRLVFINGLGLAADAAGAIGFQFNLFQTALHGLLGQFCSLFGREGRGQIGLHAGDLFALHNVSRFHGVHFAAQGFDGLVARFDQGLEVFKCHGKISFNGG